MSDLPPTPNYDALKVRTFTASDQMAVMRLYDQGLLVGQIAPNDTGADIDNIVEAYFDHPRHHFWVADLDNETIGMIGVGSDEDHTAEVRRLRVAPAHQEGGVAERLLETALSHCKANGYLKIRLDTRYEKDSALGHFERVGFQHTRTRTAPGKEVLEFYLDLYRQTTDDADLTSTP